jgi:Holliday junction resolvase RusA-like endonuclease
MIDIFVQGSPRPQSRPRVAMRGGRAMAYNADSKDMKAWKKALDDALKSLSFGGFGGFGEPMHVELVFRLPRPKSHYRTGKFSHLLKDSAPGDEGSRCDVDNLSKVVLDKITRSGYWVDDNQVVFLSVKKRWAYCESAGCEIRVIPIENK